MQNQVKEYIEKVLDLGNIVLEKPKDISLGHFATPVAFSLAKSLRKNPMMIAEELAQKFTDSKIFESVTSVKGFVNFKLSKEFLENLTKDIFKDETLFGKGENKN